MGEMEALEKGVVGGEGRGEEEERLLEGVAVLDFDMLCATVAMQAQNGKWGNCPCYRFGKNMKRAGFGSGLIQGFIYMVAVVIALLNMLAFAITKRHYFLYLAIAFTISIGAYLGFHRTHIRKKFNIRGSDSSLDDCVYHLICPCCTLCQLFPFFIIRMLSLSSNLEQEARTLEMNNVQDGIWHGRGDTVCVGSYCVGGKAFFGLNPPAVLSMKSPEPIAPLITPNDANQPNASDVGHPSLLA
nr:cell number regulator 5-like [Ipomoea batatas]